MTPDRLLHGVVPGALLDACTFWQGEDLVLRGTPKNAHSEWYNYKVEVHVKPDGQTKIIRKDTQQFCEIESGQPTPRHSSLRRIGSKLAEPDETTPQSRDDISDDTRMARCEPLVEQGHSIAAADYALSCFKHQVLLYCQYCCIVKLSNGQL